MFLGDIVLASMTTMRVEKKKKVLRLLSMVYTWEVKFKEDV